ncbi:MAG: hypothetical protein EPO42_00455 [Gallionellaceae bacterium]|nr:MAG: hypothetical protein EPO42_00455 [Gallionellaceae bacterium]
MRKLILSSVLLLSPAVSDADASYPGLQVEVQRSGDLYTLAARFDTPLGKCAAYRYLTDYELAKKLPGVVDSVSYRESANAIRVDRTADEKVLFFQVRLRSVVRYIERPFEGIEFKQLSGDSRIFQGTWNIEPHERGSTLSFHGQWEPNTVIPLFIIDHFAKNGLRDRFSAIAQLALERKDQRTACMN